MRILVRGIGDVGSAVAHRLCRDGHAVIVHDAPLPAATRRGMAFADALFDGQAELEGVPARRVDAASDLAALRHPADWVAATALPFEDAIAAFRPDVLVDARMRKRATPEPQIGLARLVVGLGPNFVAGGNVDLAVETAWGDRLGAVVSAGPTLPLAGEPRAIGGVARERFVHAPRSGAFRTDLAIGARVRAGDPLARIDGTVLAAPLDGRLRGLVRDGVPVAEGAKVIELVPDGAPAPVHGLGERPRRIAEGVARALAMAASRGRPPS